MTVAESLFGCSLGASDPRFAQIQHAAWIGQNHAMQNAFKAPPAPRYPRIDPTKPMSDKAAHMLSINGLLRDA